MPISSSAETARGPAGLGIDLESLHLDDRRLDELVELLLRLIQSMVIAPPHPPRRGAELRDYLHRWIVPWLPDKD